MFLNLFFSFAVAAISNESVGRVGSTVLTAREVKISRAVEQALSRSGNIPDSQKAVTPQEVTAVLLEQVVSSEADSFSIGQMSPDEFASTLASIQKSLQGNALLKDLQIQPNEVERILRRQLMAKNFIQFKTNAFTSVISDEEAKAYFEANSKRFAGAQFEAIKGNIKNYLAQQQLNERLKSWFELIKRKYKVRNFLLEDKSS